MTIRSKLVEFLHHKIYDFLQEMNRWFTQNNLKQNVERTKYFPFARALETVHLVTTRVLPTIRTDRGTHSVFLNPPQTRLSGIQKSVKHQIIRVYNYILGSACQRMFFR